MKAGVRVSVFGLAFLALAGGAFLILWHLDVIPIRDEDDSDFGSVAVLPLTGTGTGAEAVRLAEGIGEEIAARLTQTPLRVIPWVTSRRYRDSERSPAEIAVELGCDAVVHGVLTRADTRVAGRVKFTTTHGPSWVHEFDVALSDPRFVRRHIAHMVVSRIMGEEPEPDTAWDPFERGSRVMGADDDAAVNLFERALENDPGFAEAYAGLGTIYLRRGGGTSLKEAVRNYETALSLSPGLSNARRGLILGHQRLGRPLQCLRQVQEIPPETPEIEALGLKGWAYAWGGLPDKAIPLLERAVDMAPDVEVNLWMLVHAYNLNGQWAETIKAGNDYLSRFGNDYLMAYFMGQAHYMRGDLDSALALFKSGTSNDVDGTWSHGAYLGLTYRQLDEPVLAREALEVERRRLEHLVEATPDDEEVRGSLTLCRSLLGDTVWVKTEAERILRSSTNGQSTLALVAIGEEDLALDYLTRSLDMGGSLDYLWLNTEDSMFFGNEGLQDNPRYQKLAKRMQEDLDRLRKEY